MDVKMLLNGQLEVDTLRGVICFHSQDGKTVLRVSNIHEDCLSNLNSIDLTMGYHRGKIDHNSVRKTDITGEKR